MNLVSRNLTVLSTTFLRKLTYNCRVQTRNKPIASFSNVYTPVRVIKMVQHHS